MTSYSACVINTVVVVDVLLLLMVMLFLLVIVVEYWWYGRLKAWLWRATNDLPLSECGVHTVMLLLLCFCCGGILVESD